MNISVVKARGYLLLEVLLGSAMSAVIIGGLLTSLIAARTMSITTGRDLTATQLVLEKLEERRALGFAVSAEAPALVSGVTGNYLRATTVAACVEAVPAPGVNINCKDITVTVTFTVSVNSVFGSSSIRSSQATLRVYQ